MTREILLSLGCLGLVGCCGSTGVAPNTVYAAAHDLESKIGLAQADLNACKTDKTKCEQVEANLNDAMQTTKALEKVATDAGATP
jgi:hypothetical protein